MNKNKIFSRGGKNLTGGGKWGCRGREVGGEGEGSGVIGGGKWGLGTPLSSPPYGKAVSLRISGEYAANNWRTALFAVIVRNIFTSYREYPANKTGQSKK